MENNNKIRVLIIDDEEPARVLIRHFLAKHNNIDIVGECGDGFCGLKSIKDLEPDLLLLDIQMPKLTGFELLELLDNKPEIIFSTAYDEYAIKAFDMSAIDYLLKPFSQQRFDEAIYKAVDKINSGKKVADSIHSLTSSRPEGSPSLSRIVIRKGNSISFIPVDSIIYIRSEDDYVMIFYSGGKALKQQTMKYYENNLPDEDFIRTHRSAIVRINQIERIEPYGKDTYRAIMKDGTRIPVSRTGYKSLKEKVNF
jgi:two-component system LytT family response regulator